MNKYLIYTGQGWTEDPNGERVENCQILGRAEGENEDDALDSFLKNNPWWKKVGLMSLIWASFTTQNGYETEIYRQRPL